MANIGIALAILVASAILSETSATASGRKPNDTAINLGMRPAGFDDSLSAEGTYGRTFGVALGDVDRDGDLDIVLANIQGEDQLLYLNDGRAAFKLQPNDNATNLGTTNAAVTISSDARR